MASQLVNLLEDEAFRLELVTYKCSLQRLRVRLRNNAFIAQLKCIKTILKKLREAFPPALLKNHLINSSKSNKSHPKFIKLLRQLIGFLNDSLDKILQVYCCSQPHIRVGHLIQHLILVRASLARIRLCFKALLVHSTDAYLELNKFDNSAQTYCSEILLKHDCRPKEVTSVSVESEDVEHIDEQIGQLIDRSSLQPVHDVKQTIARTKKKRKR